MKVKFTKLAALLLTGVALFATGCTDYEKDIQEANAKIDQHVADAKQQIDALNAAISTLQSTHAADVAALNKTISDLEAALKGDIAKLQADKLDKTTFEAAKKQIEDAIDAVAQRVKAIEDADFQKQIDDLKAEVDKKATKEELQKAVTDLTALINGEIAKLDTRVKAIEAAVKEINEVTIPAMKDQIKDLQDNKVDKEDFEKFQVETAETLKLLSQAVKDLQDLTAGFPEGKTIKEYVDEAIKDLEKSLKEYVQKELEKYVTLSEFSELKAEVNGRLDALESMLKGFDEEEGSVKAYIDAEVKKLQEADQKLDEAIKAVDEDLQAAKEELEALKAEIRTVKAAIRSLVFVPEVYVDGVEAILIQTLNYHPLDLIDKDTEDEVAEEAEDSVTVSPKVIAKYHVIPSNADLSFLAEGDTVDFVIRPNDPFKTIRTRAAASEDFNVIGVYKGLDEVEPDVIKIEVTVEGTAATDDMISVVALQLTNAGEMYTSDYATIFSEELSNLRIAMPAEEDYHYRRATEAIAGTDAEAGIDSLEVYIDSLNIESCDTVLIYDTPMDLEKITEAHVLAEGEEGCVVIDPKKLELDWLFELVEIEDWEVGAIDEITLEDNKITASIEAMDLTPVVRASLVTEDEENAQIAYIKFYVAPQDFDSEVDMGEFTFSCEGDSLQTEEINIYEQLGMSKETFERVYPNFMTEDPDAVAEEEEEEVVSDEPTNEAGADAEEEEEEEEEAPFVVTFDPETGILQWKAGAEWLWDNAVDEDDAPGEPLTTEVYFVNPNNGAKITVTLSAMPAVIQAYKIPIERYIPNYWTENFDFSLYNVATPAVGETDSTKCVFVNNINASFYTDETGVIDLTGIGMEGLEVSSIEYFFCEDMKGIHEIADIEVEFTINEAGDSLYATVNDTTECIAWINNAYTEKPLTPNVVELNKESDVAKLLLNTCPGLDEKGNPLPGELYILLGANGTICGDENGEGFEVNLLWKEDKDGEWLDHFAAKYRQPVLLSDGAADVFIDAVDFGEGGSFITIKDLINPMDWRARYFDPQKDENFVVKPGQKDGIDYYSNYWEYYGDIKITVDTAAIKCTLGFSGETIDLPVTVDVEVVDDADALKALINDTAKLYKDKDGKARQNADGTDMTIEQYIDSIEDGGFGFLTYHNNLTNVTKDFDLFVPVKLRYGWGVIEKVITVKVFYTPESFQNR